SMPMPKSNQPNLAKKTGPKGEAARIMPGKDGATRIFGGGGTDFKDEAPPGGHLIGFEAAFQKLGKTDYLRAVKPIYSSPKGEVIGKQYGNNLGRLILTVKAKPGYAVGAFALNAGAGLDGFSITFMRIAGDK